MKRIVAMAAALLLALKGAAQLPYFAATVGDGKLYGYSSVKWRPGTNRQETYTTFQYGIGDHFASGIDLYTGPKCAYWGFLVRYGQTVNKWFNVGTEIIPSFNLNDSFRFSYLSSALYMNGALTKNGRLSWCSNTWWVMNPHADDTIVNNEYLGYTFKLKKGQSITPMAGTIHSWKFDREVDITAGFYYTLKSWNFYVWGNDFLKSHPRLIVGIDFAL